ncbi:DUF937 domain-containing protein [Methylobrevis pamukkalensis]|uniref:Sox C-terminal domain-containing protein n=1 Tax=Methylobrevis pamukkalensis TaxID=1439726 RepID=A0A1E3H6D3_9HYPH|nr:DUF937 domain-containing protein [Methylobrevis pamukkalensis]ODN71695.1 hypothetical protein A6302_00939 [Methylobrevis pamukkalensis]
MYTFTDLMRQAQNGRALENFASSFGMTPHDVEKLMATMLPVYAMGLQRSMTPAADPFGFFAMLKTGPFRPAFESFETAMSAQAQDAGREAMARIFGSKEAAKAVADQVALVTGIGNDIVARIMPAFTSTLLGGVGREIEKTPFAAMMETWQKTFMPAAAPAPKEAPFNPFTGPFTAPFESFMKGYAESKPEPAPPPPPEPEPTTDGLATLKHMFNAGLEMQDTNRRAFERILESYQKA